MLLARVPGTPRCLLQASRTCSKSRSRSRRWQSTLEQNPHIYVHPHPSSPSTHLLTLLATDPPTPDLAIATTTALPPTPATLTENPHFMQVLQAVVAANATADPDVQAQAQAFASSGGSSLGSGGMFFPGQRQRRQQQQNQQQRTGLRRGGASHSSNSGSGASGSNRSGVSTGGGGGGGGGGPGSGSDGAGGASAQGGPGGAGVGGFVHVSDQRNPPDWGRIAYPEDILGSVQVDGRGAFVGERGGYQASGTYRVITNDGILKISPYLREKLTEKLREIEHDVLKKQQQQR